jgi:hypothetical protein
MYRKPCSCQPTAYQVDPSLPSRYFQGSPTTVMKASSRPVTQAITWKRL